ISGRPDWPAILGASVGERFALPHLVLSGPSYPGPYGGYVTRTGGSGQLEALINGDISAWSELPVPETQPLIVESENHVLMRRLRRAQAEALDPNTAAMLDAYGLSMDRVVELKQATRAIRWDTGGDFAGDCLLAVEMLAQDLAQAVTVTYSSDWDTHALNDIWQNWHWSGLFNGLAPMMRSLAETPGRQAATLAEETVVVVLSEMGRTPGLNAEDGKDHWPYTSAMLIGPGVAGGRAIGGYDSLYYGQTVDPDSGDVSASGQDLTCESLGATLLALADLDPEEHLPGVDPILGALS
ncbi:MAG: DUF1501 domain-containing protein, partial [Alphaproteobacteria bacterium]|nr:DUF1501 domain-containing protein [Alphaproteobacteria bacterium]